MRSPEPPDTCTSLATLRRELLLRAAAFGFSRGDAEDLVHAAFVRVLPLDESIAAESLRPLLYVILRRLAIDHARHRQRWRTAPLDEGAHSEPDEPLENAAVPELELAALSEALEHCNPRDRAAFELHYVSGLRYREIARELGIAMGTVATRLHRVRAQLKAALAHRIARADE
jgi:RNA polymerase sigma factor (sigma-70 family)